MDSLGRAVINRDQRGNATKYEYDSFNSIVKYVDPLLSTATPVYDADGNLATLTDPMGNITGYANDVLNRRTIAQIHCPHIRPTPSSTD